MRIECHYCQKQYSLRDDNVGEHFRCRACGKLSPVARPDTAQPNTLGRPARPNPPAMRQPPSSQAIQHGPAMPMANQPLTARPVVRGAIGPSPAKSSGERWAIECGQCGRRHDIRADLVGKQFRCKGCGNLNPIAPPEPACDEDEEILVAIPVTMAAALPVAQVVYADDIYEAAAAPGDELFSDLQAISAASVPLAATPRPRSPAPAARRKKRKNRHLDPRDASNVAVCQRAMIRCFLLAVVLWITQLFMPQPIRMIVLIIHLITVISLIVFIFLLAVNVHGVVVGLLVGLFGLVPILNLVTMLWLNIMANRILRRHGYHVGLLGADD